VEPAEFYTGIVADLYAPLRSSAPDPAPYARFVARAGQPALELGCGAGDPLLELRRNGLDVEGVDSSADMLERCRRRAADLGLDVTLHHQRMEDLDLPRRFRSVYLAGPTFNLLPDDDAARRALRGIRAHLAEGGAALVPLFVPAPPVVDPTASREAVDDEGRVIRVAVVGAERDEHARTQVTVLRYERADAGGGPPEATERPWLLHWYTQDEFRSLAAAAGLGVDAVVDPVGRPADPDAGEFVFLLRAAAPATSS
jgi:SAM-dependent methyltransferase